MCLLALLSSSATAVGRLSTMDASSSRRRVSDLLFPEKSLIAAASATAGTFVPVFGSGLFVLPVELQLTSACSSRSRCCCKDWNHRQKVSAVSSSFSRFITQSGTAFEAFPSGFRILQRPMNDLRSSRGDCADAFAFGGALVTPVCTADWALVRSWKARMAASLFDDMLPPCHAFLALALVLDGLPAANHSLNHDAFVDSFHPVIPWVAEGVGESNPAITCFLSCGLPLPSTTRSGRSKFPQGETCLV